MKHKESIEEKINRALVSLDDIVHPDPPEFFYGRLKNRMEARNTSYAHYPWRIALAYSSVLLVILINSFTLFKSYSSIETSETAVEWLVEEYSYTTSIYDLTEE